MDYSSKILKGQALKDRIYSVLSLLEDTVISTLGPNGKTSIIYDDNGNSYVTKDGVSVIKVLKTDDPYSNIIIDIIKQAAEKTVIEAGDGTTTSTLLAVELIKYYLDTLEDLSNIDEVKDKLLKYIKNRVISIREDDVFKIAKISANNDIKMATIIEKAFSFSENVKAEIFNIDEDEIEHTVGYNINNGYMFNWLINNPVKGSSVIEDADLFIYNGHLNSLEVIKSLFKKTKNVVIITNEISEEVEWTIKHNYNKGIIKCSIIKSPGFATHRNNLLEDIATVFNTQVYNVGNIKNFTGFENTIKIKKAEIFKTSSILEPEGGIDNKQEVLENLKSLYKNSDEHNKELVKQRINLLEGKMSLIKVGAKSEVEAREKFDRYEDAILAVRSAIKYGILPGGGIVLKEFAELYGKNAEPYKSVNNIISQTVTNFKDVIDPYKVIKSSVENSASVAKLLLSTSSIIQPKYGI